VLRKPNSKDKLETVK